MDKSYLVIKWVLINCIILMLSINVYGKNNPLNIRADINRIEEINEKDGYMEFKLNMNLRFENTGDKPLILLKPINIVSQIKETKKDRRKTERRGKIE